MLRRHRLEAEGVADLQVLRVRGLLGQHDLVRLAGEPAASGPDAVDIDTKGPGHHVEDEALASRTSDEGRVGQHLADTGNPVEPVERVSIGGIQLDLSRIVGDHGSVER